MSFELIETVEVGSGGASSIEFTSIPQDGTDLVLVYSARTANVSSQIRFTFNDDTSSDYETIVLVGDGSSATSSSRTTIFFVLDDGVNPNTTTANTFASGQIYISNYTSSSAKSISWDAVTENNASEAYQNLGAHLYDSTAPITKITELNSMDEGSTFSLYKITAA